MKRIWGLFKRDIRKLLGNWVALVVVGGLMILPSLYAWFNIKASWDPYGNTSGIKVAVTNEDKGTTLKNNNINIGDMIIEKLESNTKIGWSFVSKEEAEQGVKTGKYYASILVPEDFSEKISSILTNKIEKPQLIYSVNQKINAIAPKITDKGISSLQSEVNKAFIEATSDAVLKVIKAAGEQLEDKKPAIDKFINLLFDIDDNMDNFTSSIDNFYNGALSLQDTLARIQATLPTFNDLLTKAIDISNKGQEFIISSKESVATIRSTIKDQLDRVNDLSKVIDANIKTAFETINSNNSQKAIDLLQKAKDECYTLVDIISNVEGVLTEFNSAHPSDFINNLVTTLNNTKDSVLKLTDSLIQAIDSINANGVVPNDKIDAINNNIKTINNQIRDSINQYNSKVSPEINKTIDTIYGGLNDTLKIFQKSSSVLPSISSALSSTSVATSFGSEGLKNVKDILLDSKKMIHDAATKLKEVSGDQQLSEALDIIKENAKLESEFLSSPVEIKTNDVYPIPSYGSAMTPFYTVLAIWVGALILVSLLSTHVKEDDEFKDLKAYEIYFGRLLTFLFIGFFQSLIVSLGDLFLLRIYCVNKILFVLLSLFIGFIFCTVIYTLTSTFGDIGKATGVILLVLQVAASGGTFPIELTPPFFQAINPFLPFTYAINAMRECVAGIFWPALLKDILYLLIYLAIALFIGIVLKSKLTKANEFFEEKLEKTGFM
ncbi:YhgE/Pip domain-containing protein [Clostridium fallax]|uniref:YhgE/Pip N-terminal domain-containing protein/YhgE/Pip C-terminal domain-containing protein n=2 Tax=Clostridium fallax TaxID=1533 RepID=A0A1M4TME9_9CLOT|nr:YhgE/Pip domain-containing protein [Clostridium fallax]SHE45608.1 YhgE/Pip N-terminal domain-containing protein/YhgE/Pip C-terminal domain-containing protein [Clostridium fallax]SQB22494.1 phage infection protein [Clostridium fallax]